MIAIPPRRSISLADWRTHPASAWSFQHVGEFVPAAQVMQPRGETVASPGHSLLDTIELDAPDGTRPTATSHLAASFGDAFVAMKDGAIVAEWYAPHCRPENPHIVFSVTKSVTGLLAGIAVAEGRLDPDAPVSAYVDVQSGSAYADATVRHLLDMTVALDFEEDYLDRNGPFDRYRRAMLWNPEHADSRPETLHQVLASLPRASHGHGRRFYYASPDTDMLGLVIERATGIRYADYLAERLWRPMGARGQASITVDREGTARAAGGLCVTARDLARLGQLVLDGGRAADGAQVVPAGWIGDIRSNGDRQAWVDGNFAEMFANGRYRSCWYDTGDADGCLAAVGIHEQWMWINPARRVVLVKFSSRPEPSHDPSTQREIAMLGQIARAI